MPLALLVRSDSCEDGVLGVAGDHDGAGFDAVGVFGLVEESPGVTGSRRSGWVAWDVDFDLGVHVTSGVCAGWVSIH